MQHGKPMDPELSFTSFFFLNGSLHISNDSTSYKNNLPLLDILSNGSARWEAILPQNNLQLKHLGKVNHCGFANILSAYQKSVSISEIWYTLKWKRASNGYVWNTPFDPLRNISDIIYDK